jgi:hypothetical protein
MGLLGVVIALVIGLFIYRTYFTETAAVTTMGSNNVRAIADVTGVKNDLIAMAQAERSYRELNGHYAKLEDLHASGDLLVDPARGREGYMYAADLEDTYFKITATYKGTATGMPELIIDERMQITQQ